MFSKLRKKTKLSNYSISNRITIWYTIFFILLLAGMFIGLVVLSHYYILATTTSVLKTTVYHTAEEFAEDQSDFESRSQNVYLSRYNMEGEIVEGSVPIPLDTRLQDQAVRQWSVGDTKYLYYDYFDGQQKLWFRGVITQQPNELISTGVLYTVALALPIALFIIIGGGYIIIRRAMKPLRELANTATSIEKNKDLSKRVEIDEGEDEVHHLAHSFNAMLDTVEDTYERERQFTGDVSHELRTPLAIILAESQYHQKRSFDEDQVAESFDVIERQAKQMNRLVSELLEMARIDHLSHLAKTEIPFSTLLNSVLEDFQLLAESKGRTFDTMIDPDLAIEGNEELLKRLINNLLSNALKYSASYITVRAYRSEERIVCEFENDGAGIPAEHIQKIWNRLYQVDSSRSSSGMGLGLAFVKRIATLHGAQVNVESILNEKTIFKIIF